MYGISIDDDADAPVGTKATRQAVAIKWHWTTEYSTERMASALGVKPRTVKSYLEEEPADEVRQAMRTNEGMVRDIAVSELKDQLAAAGHRSRTAETPVEVWTGRDGDLRVRDVRDEDTGEVVKRVPVPDDLTLGPDEEARYYARAEVREILEQLTDLTGAGEPDELEVSGPDGGPLNVTVQREAYDGDE